MIKKITEQKVMNVERNIATCDVCEVEQQEGTTLVVINPCLVTKNANFFYAEGLSGQAMIVCGDCLTNNSRAVKLVLDSKSFPSLRASFTEHQAKYKGQGQGQGQQLDAYSYPI